MRVLLRLVILCLPLTLATACALWYPALEKPKVAVTRLTLLPSQGLQQRFAVHLRVTNPNDRDLSLRGISYTISIENFELLAGATSDLPVLAAYEETPVRIEVSANLLEVARLIEHFSHQGNLDDVGYRFRAKLDFTRWLADMHVEESGRFSLRESGRLRR